MWNGRQAMREMLSFDWTVHSGVGVGKPCCCGQSSQNTTSGYVSLSWFMRPPAAHYSFLGCLRELVCTTKFCNSVVAVRFPTQLSHGLLMFMPIKHQP